MINGELGEGERADDNGSPATMLRRLLGHRIGHDKAPRSHMSHDAGAPASIASDRHVHPVIIAGLDETCGSCLAVDQAASEARLRGATLRIVHVQAPTDVPGRRDSDRSAGAELLSQTVDRVHSREPDVVVSTQLLVGTPAGRLIDAAMDADLVAVSHRGRDPHGRLYADSVGAYLATYGHSPVLIARVPSQPIEADLGERPVVVGVDGSLGSWAAAQFAVGEAHLRGTGLIAVYACRKRPRAWDDPLQSPWLAEEVAGRVGISIERRHVDGDPRRALIDLSAEASSLVVGAHGHGRERRGHGSNASIVATVMAESHCPLFVVPAAALRQPWTLPAAATMAIAPQSPAVQLSPAV